MLRIDTQKETPTPPDVRIRPATPADSAMLLAWANDPGTRAASIHPEEIPLATHEAWLARRLADPTSRVWIGEAHGHPIGTVRADPDGDHHEISITVAPEARGAGYGRALLRAGVDAARTELGATTIDALVRPENAPSLALFRGAGFEDLDHVDRDGVACVRLRLERDAG